MTKEELPALHRLLSIAIGRLCLTYGLDSKDPRFRDLMQNIVSAAGRVALADERPAEKTP